MSYTCEWTGDGDPRKFRSPKNWKDGRVPRKGDTTVFPDGAAIPPVWLPDMDCVIVQAPPPRQKSKTKIGDAE